MDFLVPSTTKPKARANIPELLKDLGFIPGHRGPEGVLLLEHPELLIEFLVPERGRGGISVQALPQLGVNAQPLRFMDIALMKTIQSCFEGIPVIAPHPAAFALHKLLIVPRRRNREKKRKDLDAAFLVLERLEKKHELHLAQDLLAQFPRSWQKVILETLQRNGQGSMAEKLKGS